MKKRRLADLVSMIAMESHMLEIQGTQLATNERRGPSEIGSILNSFKAAGT